MMWLILQQNKPDDYVVGTGESHSVREFAQSAFGYAGIEIDWRGSGVKIKGIVRSLSSAVESSAGLRRGDVVIEIDPRYFRPTEVDYLKADISKAKKDLGWRPRVCFGDLVRIMVDYDMKLLGLEPQGEGMKISAEKKLDYTNHDFAFFERMR